MSRTTDAPVVEHLDLYEIDLCYKRVRWVDGFDGLQTLIRHLREQADREHCYTVGGFGGDIRAVAFFRGSDLLVLTSDREVFS